MTGDPYALRPTGLMFLDDAPALPLIDPTAAAKHTGMKRHTMACYRNRGTGPRWFKLGKWARYAPEDLDRWMRGWKPRPALDVLASRWHPDEARNLLVPMVVAARVLTVTRHCMAHYRLENEGPPCRHAGHRVYYELGDLLEWAAGQERPIPSAPVIPLRPGPRRK